MKIFLITSVFLLALSSFADESCEVYFRNKAERIAYEKFNQKMVNEYPELAVILKDPEWFVKFTRSSFERQKAITPNEPYQFDFSIYGIPLIKRLQKYIALEIDVLDKKLLAANVRKKAKLDTGIIWLNELAVEAKKHLDAGKVSYKDLYEFSYFYSRAVGYFDEEDIALLDKALLVGIDRIVEGYRKYDIDTELKMYRERDFELFQRFTPVIGFEKSRPVFEKGFYNKDKLEMILLPTDLELHRDIFLRLLPYEIFITGVTHNPIPADGFVRPGGDFWIHDIRHVSAIYYEQVKYQSENFISDAGMLKMRAKTDIWLQELEDLVGPMKETNPELFGAIDLYLFNFHHDRGFPILPSLYLPESPARITYLLFFNLKMAGQPAGFKDPRSIKKAYNYLRNFWLSKLEEEIAIKNRYRTK